ncbi:MAG: endonuclease/exonuclease/phosphatase family protein [Pseudomonadota bacterium]
MGLASHADTLRIATFNTELSRKGPGLLLRDIGKGAEDVEYVLARMADVDADVWVLQGIDYDMGGLALSALAERAGYSHSFAAAPNAGVDTGLDVDGDGRLGGPRDAHGYGWFSGQGGIAVVSRYPVTLERDLSDLVWAEVPWAELPIADGRPFYPEEVSAALRLSSVGHWALTVDAPGGPFTLLTAYATTPVFDGPEDRNGLRNADELRLMEEMVGEAGPRFVVAANFNLDPEAGDGKREVIAGFLADTRLQDPHPGEPTVDFGESSAGKLRVSYVLPSASFDIMDAGVAWQEPPDSRGDVRFTRHHPVWVDLVLDGGG